MKYQEGEIVSVRLAGLTVTGIVKTAKRNGVYVVCFEGGNEKEVAEKQLKPVIEKTAAKNDMAKSPDSNSENARSTRRSPSRRSPGRNAASPRKSKASPSPSRRRRTPPRVLKMPEREENSGDDSPRNFPRRRRAIEHLVENLPPAEPLKLVEPLKPSVVHLKDSGVKEVEVRKMKSAFVSQTEVERIIHLKHSENVLNDLGKCSDDDELDGPQIPRESQENDRRSQPKSLAPTQEFFGRFGAFFLIFLIPGSSIFLHSLCSRNSCSFRHFFESLTQIAPQSWARKIFSDPTALFMYFCCLYLVTLLSALPFGGRRIKSQPSKNKTYEYCMNGLFTAFVILWTIVALEYYDIPVLSYVTEKYFQLLLSGIFAAVLGSVLLFVRSKFVAVSQLNSHAVTYNFIYDFFIGREVNPRVLGIDIKMALLRMSHITLLIINSAYLFKSVHISASSNSDILSLKTISLDPALSLSAFLQTIYALDMLVFEAQLSTSFELQYEGLGYMKTMQYAIQPFLLTATTKYLDEYAPQVCPWALGISCVVFFVGYVLYRGSNSQKNAFRLNPFDPALACLESIPTSQGKKLLTSSYWGRVRHPNYLGDILMHLSIAAVCLGSAACLGPLIQVLALVYRAVRDNNRCKRRYGASWERYTHKVRYMILPKVF